jgi:hypothetical protein
LSIQVQADIAEVEIIEIERIPAENTVETSIVYQSYNETTGQLAGIQFLMTDIS